MHFRIRLATLLLVIQSFCCYSQITLTEVISRTPPPFGSAQAAVVDGSDVFLSTSLGLLVLDVSDVANPKLIKHYFQPGMRGLCLVGTQLLATEGTNGVEVLDVSDPTNPIRVGGFDTPGNAVAVAVDGSIAYVADSASGVQAVDLTSPSQPVLVGNYDTAGSAVSVFVQDHLLYVADSSGGMIILDANNPANLTLKGKYNVTCTDVVASGSYAYTACGSAGMHQINIGDPTAPVLARAFANMLGARRVELLNKKLYVAEGTSGLHVVDLSEPAQPVIVSSSNETINSTAATGELLIGVTGSTTKIFDVGSPLLSKISDYRTAIFSYALSVDGGFTYLSSQLSGLHIVDTTDPAAPKFLGRYNTTAYGAVAHGDTVAIAAYTNGLHIVNISDRTAPVRLSRMPTSESFYGVQWEGNVVYAAEGTRGVRILDVTDPRTPSLLSQMDTPGTAFGIIVENSIAYIADWESGSQIYDVSNPRNPLHLAGATTVPAFYKSVYAIAKHGNFLYLGGDDGLSIVDVSNPRSPVAVWRDTSFGANTIGLSASNDKLVVSQGKAVMVFDTSAKTAPFQIASFLASSPAQIAFVDDYVFVADQVSPTLSGLRILKLNSNPTILIRDIPLYTPGESRTISWHGEAISSPNWEIRETGIAPPALRFAGAVQDVGGGNWNLNVEVLADASFSCDHHITITDRNSGAEASASFCVAEPPKLAFGFLRGDVSTALVVAWPAKYSSHLLYQATTAAGPWSIVPPQSYDLQGDIYLVDLQTSWNGVSSVTNLFVRLQH